MLRSVTDAAGCVVADGFAGEASAANHEFTLEPRLVGLIDRLLLVPAVFWLNLATWFGPGSGKWAEDDFTFRERMLLGRSSSGWVSSVGPAPSPSHATGLPAAGRQPFPNAQQFASISAATRNAMHFEITVIVLQRGNQTSDLTLARRHRCTRITQAHSKTE